MNASGRRIDIPIGVVVLPATGQTVCLSDIMLAVRVFAGRFEQAVAASSGPGGRPEATARSEQGRRWEWAAEILGEVALA